MEHGRLRGEEMSNIYRSRFSCECTDCKYNDGDGDCTSEWITISNNIMFLPMCQEYEETEPQAESEGSDADSN